MDFLKIASAIILYFRKQSPYKTFSSWMEWRENILPVLEKQANTGSINASINAGKAKASGIKTADSVKALLENLNEDEKVKVAEALYLYKIIDTKRNDYIPGTFNEKVWEELISLLNLDDEQQKKAEEVAENWNYQKKEDKFTTAVYVPASVLPVLLDFGLRCVALWVLITKFADQGGFKIWADAVYSTVQVLLIPFIVLVFAIARDRRVSKKGHYLVSKINISDIKLRTKISAWHYLLLFALAIAGSSVPVLLVNGDIPFFAVASMAVVYGSYLLILQTFFSKTIPVYKNIKAQVEEKEHRELAEDLSPDQNDEEIINLEVNLKAENERMDAYVIEAALFGALAFSGFLQIISSDNFTMEFLQNFNRHLITIFRSFINPEIEYARESIGFVLGKSGLMVVLCYQALFCSVFFLSVIGSRLRYSKLTDYVDRYLQLSKAFNEKEEFLLQKESLQHEKVQFYNKRIKELLKEGYKKQDEILPIMEYMQFFRTLGITMFFVIIITGGLFISPALSLVLLFISVLSLFYFRLNAIKIAIKSFYITMQEFYFRVDKPVHWVCWSMIAVALFLRSLNFPGGESILTFGFLLLFIHYLLNLFIPIEFDYNLSGKEDAFGSQPVFQKLLEYLLKIAVALFFFGLLFKIKHWPGAAIFIIVSILMLCAYFLAAKKLLNGPKWLSLFIGISVSLVLFGIMFKMQRWIGNELIHKLAVPFVIASVVLVIWKKQTVRPVVRRAVFILSIIGVLTLSDYIRNSLFRMNFNYDNYLTENKKDIAQQQLFKLLESRLTNNHSIEKVNNILQNYEKVFLDKNSFDDEEINSDAWHIFKFSDDSLLLTRAATWSEKTIKINRKWEYLDTYASLLFKLKRYEEALIYAEEAYTKSKHPETLKLIENIKASMASLKVHPEH